MIKSEKGHQTAPFPGNSYKIFRGEAPKPTTTGENTQFIARLILSSCFNSC